MADPLARLRAPSTPVDPDPGFAASLRSRLSRALDPRQGAHGRNGVVRDPFGHRWMIAGPVPGSRLQHGDLGYVSLWVPDVDRAAAFFSAVLGWAYAPASGPQGRRVEGRALHHGLWGGVTPATLFLCAAVDDALGAVGRVRAAGGTAGEPHPEPYGLVSECVDDQGVAFAVFQPPGGTGSGRPPGPARHGDLVYVTMEVVDASRARAFYGGVLGWRFTPGRVEDGWQVDGVTPMVGLSGGHPVATAVPMYQVSDIGAAVERVRRAGGTATDPATEPYGTTSSCTDDQGTRFHLVTLAHP
jgi:predicted enzyme related to lactoylglutathione lyase